MTDEELQVSLFSGQGRGGDKTKRSWTGVVYIVLILTLHISEIKHNSQLQTFKSNHYRIPILLLPNSLRRTNTVRASLTQLVIQGSRKGAGEGTAGSRRELA